MPVDKLRELIELIRADSLQAFIDWWELMAVKGAQSLWSLGKQVWNDNKQSPDMKTETRVVAAELDLTNGRRRGFGAGEES